MSIEEDYDKPYGITLNLNRDFVNAWRWNRRKYGEKFEKINGLHNSNLNFTDFIDNFEREQTVGDTTIDANANVNSHDAVSLMHEMVKPHQKLLALNKIYIEMAKKYGKEEANRWLENEYNGAFYLHDASSTSLLPYCYAYDLEDLATRGLFFIASFKTGPAHHLSTFIHHVQEFISWASNRTSGACGLPTFLFHSYGFWMRDVQNGYFTKDPETYRRQAFQEFIYALNQPYLRVVQSAFTNISIFDREYLTEIFGARKLPNGDYGIDHIEDLIEHQKVFMEVVADTRSKNMMTFPVLSYNLLYKDGKFVDEEMAHWCSDHNSKWYDSNFMNSSTVDAISNCCRLVSSTKHVDDGKKKKQKLTGFINSIGGTALSIGSVKVNTINMRRISLESMGEDGAPDQEKFFHILKKRTKRCCEVLDIVRGIIKSNVKKGFLPNYTYGLIDFDKQYSTIGVTAIYEVVKDFGLIRTDEFGNNFYTDEAVEFVKKIFDTINEVKDSFDVDFTFNIENVPGESANKKLYQKDFLLYGELKAGSRQLYANQWIALTDKCTIDEKIRTAAILDPLCSGGQIAHINLESPISPEQHWKLLNRIAKAGCQYFALNPKISVCKNGHGFFGEICPECGEKKADTFSRIVGYLVPTNNFEKTRKVEFNERQWFDLSEKV